ncbi:uncharacterized protein F4812DRAFT_471338 [Daldinia caldariorum]|uniref:uncharacterized protein n=1 Tax=Daldinia caldariorum TaxID=326644 RepID=UPI0020081949|nr:uncharacterized protein F4812DRAFT_471338 [Daldinia caldariorum]KAI1468081.1 hypothetical protein F4812DRAFT_471338 [Daldinia caldariorum]
MSQSLQQLSKSALSPRGPQAVNVLRVHPEQVFDCATRHIDLDSMAVSKQITYKIVTAKSNASIPQKVIESDPCKEYRLTPDQFDL